MILPAQALLLIPDGLRLPLIAFYTEIARNFAEHRWEPSELNGGKFCEIVYSVVDGAISGKFASAPSKPPKMVDACRALEARPSSSTRVGDRSLRILIPRVLPVLYEIRNNRGVGHVGGEVDPNFQDATAVYQMASWVMAELVRVFHQVSLADAQATVNSLVERKHPIVWEQDGMRRVLDSSLSKADQSLLLLYSASGWIDEKDIVAWVEYTNVTQFRARILLPMHNSRLLEYDRKLRRVQLTPLGADDVEQRLLPKYKL